MAVARPRSFHPLPIGVFLLFGLLTSGVRAEPGTIASDGVAVLSEPTAFAETLVQLNRGDRVEIQKRGEGWAQVRVTVPGNFSFSGWVLEHFVVSDRPAAPAPVKRAVVREKRTPRVREDTPRIEKREWVGERFALSAGFAFSLYGYQLDTANAVPGKVFSYSFNGFGPEIRARGWALSVLKNRLRFGAEAAFQYLLYNYTTRLRDGTGAIVDSQGSSSSSTDLVGKAVTEYRFGDSVGAPRVGFGAGYERFKFSADDIEQDGAPRNLFVSQTMAFLRTGLYGEFHVPLEKDAAVRVGCDLLLFGSLEEDPVNVTGASAKAGTGFEPFLAADWMPWEHHRFGLDYRFRYQAQDFSGTASRNGTDNVTDGHVTNQIHNIVASYTFSY